MKVRRFLATAAVTATLAIALPILIATPAQAAGTASFKRSELALVV
ncbi:hypothetical protein GCM10010112_71260 [Actinoplanes lobatus]|uniref:Uncharacterized protein n=1 Tax=Actinoplanes lobatus TaxID=113568 RepID=A0A7W7MKB6_9ACTN|nr:hypothetical protein [Actinoplanes lobatus]GGN88084.1 hypothetical protein GCM10010112_71260 [Actinoplanes lobatus]GIE39503.1 hypothetical protein Alo02nite_24010 [Actinoplanes lobatus]